MRRTVKRFEFCQTIFKMEQLQLCCVNITSALFPIAYLKSICSINLPSQLGGFHRHRAGRYASHGSLISTTPQIVHKQGMGDGEVNIICNKRVPI